MNTQATTGLTHILLNLLRLSIPSYDAYSTVVPAPLKDMLAATFSGAVDGPCRDLMKVLSLPDTVSRPSLAAAAQLLCDVLQQLEKSVCDYLPIEDALSTAARTIEQALAITLMAGTRSAEHATMLIDDIAVFDYLSTIVIEPSPGGPTVVLVGNVPHSLGQLQVRVPGRQLQLRKVQLAYSRGSVYPQLDVWLPSMCADAGLQINRIGWAQRDAPDARLELYTHDMRYFGQIHTMRTMSPYAIEGARITVTIAANIKASLLTTHILDGMGRELARVVKVVHL